MEQKIKKLETKLDQIYPNLVSGDMGYWCVGESIVWKANDDEPDQHDKFHAKKLNHHWVITPVAKKCPIRLRDDFVPYNIDFDEDGDESKESTIGMEGDRE